MNKNKSFLKSYSKATVSKTVYSWLKNKYANQWNRIEIPIINPHVYDQFLFDKCAKTIFSTNGARKTEYPYAEILAWYHIQKKNNKHLNRFFLTYT